MKRVLLMCLAIAFGNSGGHGAEPALDRQPATASDGADRGVANRQEKGLVGYWKLRGDCRDYSGHGNHAVNHGVDLDRGTFDGISAYVEVPGSASLKFGTGDFSVCAWIYTEKELDDMVGDVLDLFDPSFKR